MTSLNPIFRPSSTPPIGVLGTAGILAIGTASALLVVKPFLGLALTGLSAAAVLLFYLFHSVLNGKVGPVIFSWVFLFPLGYYFLSFPVEKSVVTLDRALPLALLAAMILGRREKSQRIPHDLRQCATLWLAFLLVAAASLVRGDDLFRNGRLFLDGFCLPALVGWAIIRNFEVRESTAILHLLASFMAVYVACIGLAEVVLKRDVLPLPGSGLDFAGSLPRPNGPFYSNDSFALIGLVTFFLLLFLRKTLGNNLSFSRRLIHAAGLSGSITMALLPMFRSVLITLLLVLLIEIVTTRRCGARVAKTGLLVFCIALISAIKLVAPEAYEDRSRPDNFYGRIAEQLQTLDVFRSHPIAGVGLGNFPDFATGDTRYLAFYGGVGSLNSPHNNLGAVLAETGIIGFVPYVGAQIALVLAFWRLRKRRTPDSELTWKFFLYVFLSYSVSGLTLASGYHSDLNLWFILTLSVLYKYAWTETLRPRDDDSGRLPSAAVFTPNRLIMAHSRYTVALSV